METNKVRIKVIKDGPYEVSGLNTVSEEVIIADEEGASEAYKKTKEYQTHGGVMELCRCGKSKNAPFCDGSHKHIEWDGEETASFEPIRKHAQVIPGPNLTLLDNEQYCAFARFCDAKGRIWNLVQKGTAEADQQATKEAFQCPAGRLMMHRNDGTALEPKLEPEISALEDVPMACSGPLYVKGNIEIESSDGRTYEVRNRQTLCRCGQSSNKPFCDGSHASIHFHAH